MARGKSALPQFILLLVLILIVWLVLRNSRLLLPPEAPRHAAHEEHRRRESREKTPYTENEPFSSRAKRPEATRPAENCSAVGVSCSSQYFAAWRPPAEHSCRAHVVNGYPEPDPRCTPGGGNPSVTVDTLRNPAWRTGCVRNCESTEQQKHIVYKWYGIPAPHDNQGANQVCELDHLVPLELGGADGLGNLWPECGPDATALDHRYFKIKDRVENYLAEEVRAGRMPLDDARRGIASDWTRYLDAANEYCRKSRKC